MKSAEIWLVDFHPSIGDEITKIRPAVVVSNDRIGRLDLKVVVPLSDSKKPVQTWHVRVKAASKNGLNKDSLIDCFQVKSVSTRRFVRKLGVISEQEMLEVKLALSRVLDLI